jgi:hypothetical protein
MPYIKEEQRSLLEEPIRSLIQRVISIDDEDEYEGVCNYIVTTLLNEIMIPPTGPRYRYVNRIMGILECVKAEFYRRLASSYEQGAIIKNGDLRFYATMSTPDGDPALNTELW